MNCTLGCGRKATEYVRGVRLCWWCAQIVARWLAARGEKAA